MRSGDRRHALALHGERAAERHLARMGMRIVARRYRTRGGEIDLVAIDRDVVVFVEVKTRRGRASGRPADAVTPVKRRRLALAAEAFLFAREWLDRTARFDVVEVVAPTGRPPILRHIRDAFRPDPTPLGERGRAG